jgi:hypothetical protein
MHRLATNVRTLEESYGEVIPEQQPPASDLPSADDVLRDIEDFLRGSGDD